MRTSIFLQFPDLPKEFREDFQILWSLSAEQRHALISHASEIFKADTTRQTRILMEKAVGEIGGHAPDVLRAVKLLSYIYSEWNPFSDTRENFRKDLQDLGLIPLEIVEEANTFFSDLLAEIQRDNVRRKEKIYGSSLLPNYVGASALVDFRAIFPRPFGSGPDDKIEEYNPSCVGFVPVVIIRIRLSSGDPRHFDFQAEEVDIRRLIERLEAALMELDAAKKTLPGGEKENESGDKDER